MMMLMVLAAVVIAQQLLWRGWFWRHRVSLAFDWWCLHLLVLIAAIIATDTYWTLLLVVPTLYQSVLCARVAANRVQAEHLQNTAKRTSVWLLCCELTLIALISAHSKIAIDALLIVAATVVCLVYAVLVFWGTRHHLLHTKTIADMPSFTDASLPSISVLLPARNETEDLKRCLETLISSTYPKLEIIVLDDCSQNRHTPQIIKDFAQAGVRFLPGKQPPTSWLPKNYAYQQLAEAASGDYLVFCDVDARLQPSALREVVGTMLQKQKTMLSVLPKNAPPSDVRSYLFQPLRYAWELCLPRRLVRRPAVLTSLWVIKKQALVAAGSFKATSRSMTPESYLAKFAARTDGYSFVRSTAVRSITNYNDQTWSARRLRYPQLHRRPEVVLTLSLVELICSAGVITMFILGVINSTLLFIIVAIVTYLATLFAYGSVSAVMYGRVPLLTPILAPLALLVDCYTIHRSMFAYEFGDVTWKDRNICLPVMRIDRPENQYLESK